MATLRGAVPRSASTVILIAGVACGGSVARGTESPAIAKPPFIPLTAPHHYVVKFMGITCGHMVLESAFSAVNDRPAYHIILTARNSSFFNRIHKVEGRIEAWIDVESETTVAYHSLIDEKGEVSSRSYAVNSAEGIVIAVKNGESRTMHFDPGTPVLDPLTYLFRLRVLAREPGATVALTLLTDDGPLRTVARVGNLDRRRTNDGPRELLEVRPMPADGEMFSRKGEVTLWIDPSDEGRLYTVDFKLAFGHLKANLD